MFVGYNINSLQDVKVFEAGNAIMIQAAVSGAQESIAAQGAAYLAGNFAGAAEHIAATKEYLENLEAQGLGGKKVQEYKDSLVLPPPAPTVPETPPTTPTIPADPLPPVEETQPV